MGQEASTPVDESTPTQTLSARTVEAIASYINEGRARKIVVMGLLLKLFTQNIDCLERAAGVPDEKIVEAHGSFARQRCIECHRDFPDDLMKQAISRHQVPHCIHSACGGLVKPDIVFFGEALPEDFHRNRTLPSSADLAIVMGTSLTVQPFASLPGFCAEGVPRVLLNLERVGGLGSRADDVLLLGDCDQGVQKLASALGWLEDLEALFETHNPDMPLRAQSDAPRLRDDNLDNEIAKITKEVDSTLRISSQHSATSSEIETLPNLTLIQSDSSNNDTTSRSQPSTATDVRQIAPENTANCEQGIPGKSVVEGEGIDQQDERPTMPDSQQKPSDSATSKSSL
ncbi:MAG: hypothetical protein Q9225_001622 [Loekoesia sp. 1 TL-2023]